MKKQNKKSEINKNMNFMEIIQKNPEAFGILFRKGMHCIGSGMAANETLEEVAIAHGIDPDELVSEINNSLKKAKPKKKIKTNNKTKQKKKQNGRK
jgi:hybrid cluster-associated redox disulfide protein